MATAQELIIEESANVGVAERMASVAGGVLLMSWGLKQRSPATLAGALVGADLIYRGATGHSVLYRALGVNTATTRKPGSQISPIAPQVRRAITIGKSAEELYSLWRDPIVLAQVVAHFAIVTPRSEGITHWRVRGPAKQTLEWDSRYIEEKPGQKLVWETLPGSTMANVGELGFKPGPDGTGTEVTLHMEFEPPLGTVGAAIVSTLHMLPRAIAGQSLRRFKSLAETGEVPTLAHNVSARGTSDSF